MASTPSSLFWRSVITEFKNSVCIFNGQAKISTLALQIKIARAPVACSPQWFGASPCVGPVPPGVVSVSLQVLRTCCRLEVSQSKYWLHMLGEIVSYQLTAIAWNGCQQYFRITLQRAPNTHHSQRSSTHINQSPFLSAVIFPTARSTL